MTIDCNRSLHAAWAPGLTMDLAERGITIIEEKSLA